MHRIIYKLSQTVSVCCINTEKRSEYTSGRNNVNLIVSYFNKLSRRVRQGKCFLTFTSVSTLAKTALDDILDRNYIHISDGNKVLLSVRSFFGSQKIAPAGAP